MECFGNELINVCVSNTTVKRNTYLNIILKISNTYGFVNNSNVIINQKNGRNAKEIQMNYYKTENDISYFKCDIKLENLGVHYFCIKLVLNNEIKWIKAHPETKEAVLTENDYPYWNITVYDENFEVPNWAKGKIMYHIMVDRFYKSDKYVPKKIKGRITEQWGKMPEWEYNKKENINKDFFMGNLLGIEEKIPYLKKLGVQILYLSPICCSQSNHRYDTADYELVDPYLGTNLHLKSLCDSAHKNNMRVIIDAVFNHTGNDSKYFNEYNNYNTVGAFQSKESKYYNWYLKNENEKFTYWWGFKNLPVCDGNNLEWQQYIYGENGIIDKWFELGIDGLRLDVADELTDEFIENIRIAVKRNKKDGFILGEVWENAITKEKNGVQRTYLLGKGLDSVMNYPITNAILKYVRFGNYKFLEETINEIITQYPKEVVYSLMNSLSTHDITRAITTLVGKGIQNNKYNLIWDVPYSRKWQFQNDELTKNEYELGKKMFQVATVIQYFLPGNTCIYYGDEIGLTGYKDPFNRKCFTWDKIDNDLNDFFVNIGNIKNAKTFLEQAEVNIICLDENIFMFERNNNSESLLIIVNRTNKKVDIEIPDKFKYNKIIFKKNYEEDRLQEYGYIIIEK